MSLSSLFLLPEKSEVLLESKISIPFPTQELVSSMEELNIQLLSMHRTIGKCENLSFTIYSTHITTNEYNIILFVKYNLGKYFKWSITRRGFVYKKIV